jgi:uncharacterized protein (UPF0262 family)
VSEAERDSALFRIAKVFLDEEVRIRRKPEVEHERAIAIYDLLENNRFAPNGLAPGPYHLHLSITENRLALDIRTTENENLQVHLLSLKPFRTIVRDYFMICDSYYSAIKTKTLAQIEAIDMGRRGLHNEGAALLRERLNGKIEMDEDTSRRLFTLICVLHIT